jgi:hypothetical protein
VLGTLGCRCHLINTYLNSKKKHVIFLSPQMNLFGCKHPGDNGKLPRSLSRGLRILAKRRNLHISDLKGN